MIAIIGGGITGLAAAFELASRRVPFVLCESGPRLGGLIQTDHVDGFTIEAGPDSVLVQKRAALDLFAELGLTPHVIATKPPRTAYVVKRGRLYPLPSPSILGIPTTAAGLARYELLSPAARARVALERLLPAEIKDDESVASFFGRRFGRATVELIAEPLLGGIHAGDIEMLSVHSLFPRLVEAERTHRSVLRAFENAPPGAGGDGLFRSLSGGMGTLVAAIEQRLPAASVRLDTAIERLQWSGHAWTASTASDSVDADAIILAVPASTASRLLSTIDADMSRLCAEVRYVSTVSVALAWRRGAIRHPLEGSGFVVARRHNTLRITACTWVSSKWEGRAPDGAVLLRVFIGSVHDPDTVDLDDRALTDIATRDVAAVLGVQAPPEFARVYRWRNAGAQHNVGQLARMARIERRLAAFPGLFVAGSGFRSLGIPDCISDGREAALRAARMVNGQWRMVDGE